jgi:hypothetical protein
MPPPLFQLFQDPERFGSSVRLMQRASGQRYPPPG